VRIASVTVGPETVEAVLIFDSREPLRTSSFPGLPERALRLLPGLRGHRCDNGIGMTFPDEMADTEVAHLVEHAAVELMALSGSPTTLAGRTEWDFPTDGRGVFRVRLDYDDDLVAIGALKEAAGIVSWLTGEGLGGGGDAGSTATATATTTPAPDVRAAVVRLRAARHT
jgi:Cyanophycin synthase-like N-terminal domain